MVQMHPSYTKARRQNNFRQKPTCLSNTGATNNDDCTSSHEQTRTRTHLHPRPPQLIMLLNRMFIPRQLLFIFVAAMRIRHLYSVLVLLRN